MTEFSIVLLVALALTEGATIATSVYLHRAQRLRRAAVEGRRR